MSVQSGKAPSRTGRRLRRHARYRCAFPVVITLFVDGQYRSIQAQGKDISEAGIGLLVASEVPLDEVASLNFTLPGASKSWDVSAVFRQRWGYHYGLEFLSLGDERTQVLRSYLSGLEQADDSE